MAKIVAELVTMAKVDTREFERGIKKISSSLQDLKSNELKIDIKGTSDKVIKEKAEALMLLKPALKGLANKDIDIKINVKGSSAKTLSQKATAINGIKGAVQGIQNKSLDIKVNVKGTSYKLITSKAIALNTLRASLDSFPSKGLDFKVDIKGSSAKNINNLSQAIKNFSPDIDKLENDLDGVVRAFKKLEAVDLSNLKIPSELLSQLKQINKLNADFNKINSSLGKSKSSADSFAKSMGSIGREVKNMMPGISKMGDEIRNFGVAATLGTAVFELNNAIFSYGKEVVSLSNNLDMAEISFSKLLGSQEAGMAMLQQTQDIALRTPFEQGEVIDATRKLMAYGFQAQEVERLIYAIGDATAVAGDPAAFDRIAVAIGQIRTSAKASAQEMNQLKNAGIPISDILQEELGLSAEEVQNIGDQEILGSTAADAIIRGLEKRFGGAMVELEDTVQGNMSAIMDSFKMIGVNSIQPIMEPLNGYLGKLKETMTGLVQVSQQGGFRAVLAELIPDSNSLGLVYMFMDNVNRLASSFSALWQASKPIRSALNDAFVLTLNLILPIITTFNNVLAKLLSVIPPNSMAMKIFSAAVVTLSATLAGLFIITKIITITKGLINIVGLARGAFVALSGTVATATGGVAAMGGAFAVLGGVTLPGVLAAIGGIVGALSLLGVLGVSSSRSMGRSSREMDDGMSSLASTIDEVGQSVGSIDEVEGSIGNVGESAEDAADALAKAKGQLLAFDEVYSLSKDDGKGTGGGGSGGGGGGGGEGDGSGGGAGDGGFEVPDYGQGEWNDLEFGVNVDTSGLTKALGDIFKFKDIFDRLKFKKTADVDVDGTRVPKQIDNVKGHLDSIPPKRIPVDLDTPRLPGQVSDVLDDIGRIPPSKTYYLGMDNQDFKTKFGNTKEDIDFIEYNKKKVVYLDAEGNTIGAANVIDDLKIRLSNMFGEIPTKAGEMFGKVKTNVAGVWTEFTGIFSKIVSAIPEPLKVAGKAFGKTLNAIEIADNAFFIARGDKQTEHLNILKLITAKYGEDTAKQYDTNYKLWEEQATEGEKEIYNAVKDAYKNMGDLTKEEFYGIEKITSDHMGEMLTSWGAYQFDSLSNTITFFDKWNGKTDDGLLGGLRKITDFARDGVLKFGDWITGSEGKATEFYNIVTGKTKLTAEQSTKNLEKLKKDGLLEVDGLNKAIGTPMDAIKSQIDTKTKTAADKGKKNMNNLNKEGSKEIKDMSKDVEQSMGGVDRAVVEVTGMVSKDAVADFDKLRSEVSADCSAIIRYFDNLRSEVSADCNSMKRYWTELGTHYSKTIKGKIEITKTETTEGKSKMNVGRNVGSMGTAITGRSSYSTTSRSNSNNYNNYNNQSINYGEMAQAFMMALDSSNALSRIDNNTRMSSTGSNNSFSMSDRDLRELDRRMRVISQVEGERRWG